MAPNRKWIDLNRNFLRRCIANTAIKRKGIKNIFIVDGRDLERYSSARDSDALFGIAGDSVERIISWEFHERETRQQTCSVARCRA